MSYRGALRRDALFTCQIREICEICVFDR